MRLPEGLSMIGDRKMTTGGTLRFEEGIDVQVRVYNPANRSDADRGRLFEESRSDAEALEKRVQDSRTFVPVSDYLALLASFEPSYVMMWYGCDNFVSWNGNEIYEATGKRVLNLQFGSSNPMMLWREMFNVYVAEGFEQPAQEQPRSLYQRFVDWVRT